MLRQFGCWCGRVSSSHRHFATKKKHNVIELLVLRSAHGSRKFQLASETWFRLLNLNLINSRPVGGTALASGRVSARAWFWRLGSPDGTRKKAAPW